MRRSVLSGVLVALGLLPSRHLLASPVGPGEAGEENLERRVEQLEEAKATLEQTTKDLEALRRRLEDLEAAKSAAEDATRKIISETQSKLGNKINEYVVFGGTLEALVGWMGFQGRSESLIRIDTAELEFEVELSNWIGGSLVFEYVDGGDRLFLTAQDDAAPVDRINVDTTFLRAGDPQMFWLTGALGRMIVPFGISTGDPVADVLTLDDPLTVEIFEMREDAMLIGVAFPTPPLTPVMPIPDPPRIRPTVIVPFASRLGGFLGYKPLPRSPPVMTYSVPPAIPPRFNAGVYLFNGNTFDRESRKDQWQPGQHIGGTLGYLTRGKGWSLDVDLGWTRSVFDSRFLEFEYRRVLEEIGFVPGMAASAAATVGQFSLVGEWNGALHDASFIDDGGASIRIKPRAWQLSLAYQMGWKPELEVIGDEGSYFALSYSRTKDMAGVSRFIDDELERVGAAPESRLLLSMGEWIVEGVRLAFEYSRNSDYAVPEGGTGEVAHGFATVVTLVW